MYPLLILLQVFHVLFLALHDWVPLGNLNDPRAVRHENPGETLLMMTVISTVPFIVPLWAMLAHAGGTVPRWVWAWLWLAYGALFVGEMNAWWRPYFFGTQARVVARYRAMFGHTHAFLPRRHGIKPNTLHVVLHAATLSTLVLLAAMKFLRRG